MALRVVHVSAFDAVGGAARAARALHLALLDAGADSWLVVGRRDTDDPRTVAPGPRAFALAGMADRQLWRLERSPRVTWRSPALLGALRASTVLGLRPDIVNLHWVTNGLLSIRQLGRLAGSGVPVAWSMVDQFPFSGTEHYEALESRWGPGYAASNRPGDESGLDLDRWAWQRKRRHWSSPVTLVPASAWLEDCVRRSALLRGWPTARIPHVVDTGTYAPMDRAEARRQLGLPDDRPLVLFLASAGIGDHRKGWDLLEDALARVRGAQPGLEAVVAGPVSRARTTVPVRWLGEIGDAGRLRAAYAAADVVAVPSRADTMPLTAMEAQACGRPVVAFRIGGLPDIVDEGVTGALAAPESVPGLADALERALRHGATWGPAARARAVERWSPPVVARAYLALYEGMLAR